MEEHLHGENIFQEIQDSGKEPRSQKLEIVSTDETDSLQRRLKAMADSIGHDQPVTEADFSDLNSAVKNIKIDIGGKEVALKAAEDIATVNSFLGETNVGWGVKEEDLPVFRCEFVDPRGLKYEEKNGQIDKKLFGEYTLNPETFGVDFEKAKVFIPDLSSMEGKKLYEVFQYVADTLGAKYRIPDIGYWKWMIENPEKIDKIKSELKDGNLYFLPGSLVRNSDGNWNVPYARWNGFKWRRYTNWLGYDWNSNYRVVLLEI